MQISYEAFCLNEQLNGEREADAINGDIVTESESDDARVIRQNKTQLDYSMKTVAESSSKAITQKRNNIIIIVMKFCKKVDIRHLKRPVILICL